MLNAVTACVPLGKHLARQFANSQARSFGDISTLFVLLNEVKHLPRLFAIIQARSFGDTSTPLVMLNEVTACVPLGKHLARQFANSQARSFGDAFTSEWGQVMTRRG